MQDGIKISTQSWPILNGFAISREVKTSADTVLVEITRNGITGRGECVPLKRYHHSQESVKAEIESVRDTLMTADLDAVQTLMPAGPARNAVDCALWDLTAKTQGKTLAKCVGIPAIQPLKTAYTLSLDSPEKMVANARAHDQFALLKMKMNGSVDDVERIKSVKAATPNAKLILDANEAWSLDHLQNMIPLLMEYDVVLIEQPLPEGGDDALLGFDCPIPLAADESCHTVASLAGLVGKYQVVNIKLDKTGGLTHALSLKNQAVAMGFDIMVGCMTSTSLGIAPAMVVGQDAKFCDLDGALLLENDPYGHVVYQNGMVFLW